MSGHFSFLRFSWLFYWAASADSASISPSKSISIKISSYCIQGLELFLATSSLKCDCENWSCAKLWAYSDFTFQLLHNPLTNTQAQPVPVPIVALAQRVLRPEIRLEYLKLFIFRNADSLVRNFYM